MKPIDRTPILDRINEQFASIEPRTVGIERHAPSRVIVNGLNPILDALQLGTAAA